VTGKNARTESDVQVSRIVAENVRRLREARGLSLRGLTRKVVENGHRMNPSSLCRIEIGTHATGGFRPVTVDELVALAKVFELPPERLLAEPKCHACLDSPPAGFACRTCGAES